MVDDNADMRDYLTRLLAPHYRVRTARDSLGALRAARDDAPELVLTDVMMPGLDGFGLLAALRAEPGTATVPVTVLSARAGPDSAIDGFLAGADDYLVKPFSSAELPARVRSLLVLAQVRRREATWRRALIESMQDAFYVMDLGGGTAGGGPRVVEVNEAFASVFGYGRDGVPYSAPFPWSAPDAH